MKTCPYCGREIGSEATFCWYCTRELVARPERPEPAPKPSKIKPLWLVLLAGLILIVLLALYFIR